MPHTMDTKSKAEFVERMHKRRAKWAERRDSTYSQFWFRCPDCNGHWWTDCTRCESTGMVPAETVVVKDYL